MSVKGTLYTQYETSSIIYTSGSTKFGNSFDDLHETTGSVFFTGSHTINGEDYTYYSSSNSTIFTNFSSSNSTAITAFSSSNSTLFTTYSSSNSTLFTNFSSSNSSYNTSFSSSNEIYVTALSSSNSTYNTTFSSSNSTLFTNFSSSNSTYNTTFSSSNSTYNTTFSSSNATYVTALSSSNSTTFTNYSSSTANTINGLSSGVSSELARVYQATASIQAQTSSLLAFTASQVDRNTNLSIVTGSLNNFTASQDSRNFVISQFTASTDAHIVGIAAFTSSQLAVNLTISSVTGSLIGITNGLMAFTAALDNTYATDAQLYQLYQATRSIELHSGSMIGITNGLMDYTASNETWKTGVRGEINGIESYTASLKAAAIVSSSTQIQNYDLFALNSNLYIATGSIKGEIAGIESYTASLKAQTIVSNSAQLPEIGGIEAYTASLKAAAIVSSSTQVVNYNLFALTASANTFYGTQSVTGSVRISGSIDDISYIDFDTVAPATAVARLGWDDGEGTLTIGLSGGNVNIPIGVTNFETAYNADSSSISKGDVVRISGAQGNRVAIQKANNLNDDGSATTVALAAETIGVGAQGKVILSGPLKGIDTTAFAEGDLLYLSSTPGGITNIKPQAPFHEVRIGVAQRISATVGIVNVKVDNGYEIDELHNVRITTASLAFNQLLAYSGSVWRNETIDGLGIATTASLNPVLAYTASLKGAAIVSSSQQIQNYNLFAQTSSANTFYGVQSVSGSVFVTSNSGFGSSDATGSGILKVISAGTQNAFSIGQSNSKRFTGFGANDLKVYGDDYFITTVDAFPLSIGTNGISRITIANDGGINATGAITASNFRISTAGGGIDFSVTSNGSGTTTSELLNDYEEGTWTPVLKGSTTAGTYTYDTDRTNGKYIKIGNQVNLIGVLRVDTVTSAGSGNALIGGIPFAPATIDLSWDRVPGVLSVQSGPTLPSASLLTYTQGNTFSDAIGMGYNGMEGWNQLDVTLVDVPNAIWFFNITYHTI
jgi:hypothetical protein